MAAVMIGSINVPIPVAQNGEKAVNFCAAAESHLAIIPKQNQMATQKPSVKGILHKFKQIGDEAVHSYEQSLLIFAQFFQKDSTKNELLRCKHGSVQKMKGGGAKLRRASMEQALREEAANQKRQEEEAAFLAGAYEHQEYVGASAVTIPQSKGESVGFKTKHYKPSQKQPAKRLKMKRCTKLVYALEETLSLAATFGKPIELIMKRKKKNVTIRYVKRNGGVFPKIDLPHESGIYRATELQYENVKEFLPFICMFAKYREMTMDKITYGDSGLLFDERSSITTMNTELPYFCVRGRRFGKLVSAFDTHKCVEEIQHY
nr:P1 protein [Wisteria vein mosaic virus]